MYFLGGHAMLFCNGMQAYFMSYSIRDYYFSDFPFHFYVKQPISLSLNKGKETYDVH